MSPSLIPGAGICALTGANGYVGSILRRGLEAAGWKVVPLSRRPGLPGNEIAWSLDATGTIAEELKRNGVSALVHAAWDLKLVRPAGLERVNVQGSLRLFDEARAAGLSQVVFISTISAFRGVRSHYGQTKLAVELATAGWGGVAIRPGLVYGDARSGETGGMFGALKKQTSASSTIPLIGDGSYPQYLVHESDLAEAVVNALAIEKSPEAAVTVAHPHPWPLRLLMEEIARSQGKSPRFVPVPWPLIYGGLRAAEAMGFSLGFRSDSITSLVHQNPSPDWNAGLLGVTPRAFESATHLSRGGENAL